MTRGVTRDGQGGIIVSLLARGDADCRGLARLMLLASGWAVLFMGVLIAADVIWRAVSGSNFGGVDEIASYLLAVSISWSLAAAFHARAHIRVDLVYRMFPLPVRAVVDALATLSLLGVALFLLYSSWTVLGTSWSRGSTSASTLQIPMIVPQATWAFGAVVFLASLLISWLRLVADLLGGRFVDIVRQHGVLSADEEAMDALTQSRGGR